MAWNAMRRAMLGGLLALALVTGSVLAVPAKPAMAQTDGGEIDPCAEDPYRCWCFYSGQCPAEPPGEIQEPDY
ncbi:MAG TPA: hypothetical protein VFH48_04630 [Chloroflexota bacterium]|nr:hypothetical protein [Chloroflexota bacterium]